MSGRISAVLAPSVLSRISNLSYGTGSTKLCSKLWMNEICRLLPLDAQQELLQNLRRRLGLDEHALGIVEDPAFQVQFFRQTVDKRAEADALHGAADDDPDTLELAASHSLRLGVIITRVCDG